MDQNQELFRRLRTLPLGAPYAIAAVCIGLLGLLLGQMEFAGYDCSMLIDAGWRTSIGQRPYIDFPNMLPPGFLLTSGAAVKVFGPHWYAFTLAECCFFLAIAASAFWMVRTLAAGASRGRRAGILFGFLIALSIPQLATVHLWHSLEGSLCATLLMLWFALISRTQSEQIGRVDQAIPLPWFSFVVPILASGLLWLSKPNMAVIGHVALLAFPLFWRRTLRYWGIISSSGLALAMLILFAARINPLRILASYRQISGRPSIRTMINMFAGQGMSWRMQLDGDAAYTAVALAAVLATILMGVFLFRRQPGVRIGLPVLLSGLTVSVVGMLTNWDVRSDDMAPLYFGFAFALLYLTPTGSGLRLVRLGGVAALALFLLPMGYCFAQRSRMVAAGRWGGAIWGKAILEHDSFFGTFRGRKQFWDTLHQIDAHHAQYPNDPSFFGTRLEFEYARYHMPSPEHLPIWWHPGSSYPVNEEPAIVNAWQQHRFTMVYIADYVLIPKEVIDSLKDYDLISRPDEIVYVYRRKPGR